MNTDENFMNVHACVSLSHTLHIAFDRRSSATCFRKWNLLNAKRNNTRLGPCTRMQQLKPPGGSRNMNEWQMCGTICVNPCYASHRTARVLKSTIIALSSDKFCVRLCTVLNGLKTNAPQCRAQALEKQQRNNEWNKKKKGQTERKAERE